MCFYSIFSTTQLTNKIHSSEAVLESDTSNEGSSCNSCSNHDDEGAVLEVDGDETPVETATDNGGEGQDLEYSGE